MGQGLSRVLAAEVVAFLGFHVRCSEAQHKADPSFLGVNANGDFQERDLIGAEAAAAPASEEIFNAHEQDG